MCYRATSWLLPVLFLGEMISVGCGGSGSSGGSNSSPAQSSKILDSIVLTPSSASLKVGGSQQFTAAGSYSDGSQADITSSATWATSNPVVATVNASGLLNAIAQGTASVTANIGTISAKATVPVSPTGAVPANSSTQGLSSITITPSTLSLPPGSKKQLTVTGQYTDNTQADLTATVAWKSSNGSVATVSSTGLLSAVGAGMATITATDNSIAATLAVAIGANVPTWHNDNERTGLNPNETTLTPANVNTTSFGKLFSYLVDGYIYAQPLYISNLTIGGAVHNVVFVATENDSVYAFDALQYGNGSPLWQRSLLQAGETAQPGGTINPIQGVTSTPAIDLASNTMYVVSAQKGATGSFFRLHALDLLTGAEKLGGPVPINAHYPGTNAASVNGSITLTAACIQRAALLLANNAVFVGFANCKSSGWMLSYDSRSLVQIGVMAMSPNLDSYGKYDGSAGVWMGGGGPAADSSGSVYFVTADGPYDGITSFSDSVMKFNAQLQLLDHFTTDNWAFMQCDDADLGSGGVLLLPGTSQALVGGKTGKMYLVNTDKMGNGMQPNDAGVTQSLWFEQDLSPFYPSPPCLDTQTGQGLTTQVTGYQIYGTAAFFNNWVYLGVVPSLTSIPGRVRQFTYLNGLLTPGSVTPDSIAPNSYGTTPFISANGTANGIVWVLDHGLPIEDPDNVPATSAVLRAYDATNLNTELYNSKQNTSDTAGLGIKFTSPIVANGRVFIGTGHDSILTPNPRGELDVYGLK